MMTLGRKCHHIQTLSLICCGNITDTGLSEIGKKIHLTEFELSHNVRVTDVSVEAILSSSGSLVKLTLINCPKLTDRTIGALYEADRSWGKKRNLKSLSMQQLVVRDNYNVTTQVGTSLVSPYQPTTSTYSFNTLYQHTLSTTSSFTVHPIPTDHVLAFCLCSQPHHPRPSRLSWHRSHPRPSPMSQ